MKVSSSFHGVFPDQFGIRLLLFVFLWICHLLGDKVCPEHLCAVPVGGEGFVIERGRSIKHDICGSWLKVLKKIKDFGGKVKSNSPSSSSSSISSSLSELSSPTQACSGRIRGTIISSSDHHPSSSSPFPSLPSSHDSPNCLPLEGSSSRPFCERPSSGGHRARAPSAPFPLVLRTRRASDREVPDQRSCEAPERWPAKVEVRAAGQRVTVLQEVRGCWSRQSQKEKSQQVVGSSNFLSAYK